MSIQKSLVTVLVSLSISALFVNGSARADMQFLHVDSSIPMIVDNQVPEHWYRFRGANYNLIHHTTLYSPSQADIDNIAGLGPFHIIRLPINWNFLEPSPGEINQDYINSIESIVQWAANDDIWVMIDMSQWNTSQCFNTVAGNGFPGWVVDDMLEYFWGSQTATCAYFDGAGQDEGAINSFWDAFWQNPTIPASAAINAGQGNTVWDAYSYIWRVLAWDLRDYPNVIGWDMANEPEVGDLDPQAVKEILPTFYEYIGTRIRWSDTADQYGNQHHILFFENVETSDYSYFEPPNLSNIALAPHAYIPQNEWGNGQDAANTANPALNWASANSVPAVFGEFGSDTNTTDGETFAYNMSHIISVSGQSWIWYYYDTHAGSPPNFSLVNSKGKAYPAVSDLQQNIDIYSGTECPN